MSIGRHSYVGGFNKGEDPKVDNLTVGEYSSIGEGFYVHQADNFSAIFNRSQVCNYSFGDYLPSFFSTGLSKGNVIIGNDVWIGRDVKVLSGVQIGDGAIVAAHSVVTKNVPPYAMVAGNPAHIKYFKFGSETIDKLLKIKWWNWDEKTIQQRIKDFRDVTKFVEKYDKK